MKQTGKCPKCNSTEIYFNKGNRMGARAGINVDVWGGFNISVYICADCGFIEEFMSDEHFKAGRMDKVKSKWNKYSKYDQQ